MSTVEATKSQSETVRKHKEFLFPAVATYYQEPLALVRGEGMHVWDDEGNRYLDCFGGVLTVSVGHANPRGQDRHGSARDCRPPPQLFGSFSDRPVRRRPFHLAAAARAGRRHRP